MLRLVAIVLIGAGLVLSGAAMSTRTDGTLGLLMAVLGGLGLAAGVVMFGIGMGRWQHPRRHPQPGDAVVDPASHDKMDHV